MESGGESYLLRIFIGETDQWHGKPLYQAIVERARADKMAGATVLRGLEGFGARSHLHTARLLRLSEDLPVVIEIVDRQDNIDHFLPQLQEMIGDGMATLERVTVLYYGTRQRGEEHGS